jgi:DNA-binding NtrC family response regulator
LNSKNKKIIIVEDQPIVALDFMNLFQVNGYMNISSFFSGKDAIENIKLEKPDLALLDIRLKDDISGLDIASLLNNLNVPFIFISAFSDNNNYQKALKLKPAHIFTKPVNQSSLLKSVEAILSKKVNEQFN